MASFVCKLQTFGLIDDAASPATRVEVADVSSEVEATIRDVPERNTDPDGATVFAGFQSEIMLRGLDVGDFPQADTWLSGRTKVKAIGVTYDGFIQFYNAARMRPTKNFDPSQAELMRSEYQMMQDGGDLESHDVYITRNGLYHLAPIDSNGDLAGGWADTDSNGTPDGYTETNLNSAAFTSNVYEAYVDTGAGTGSLNVTIPFPADQEEVTLSVDVNQVHDDGNQAVRIEALDASQSTITGGISDVTFSTTGRKSATLTTPDDTHYLKLYPLRVTSVSANTTKAKIENPCLRTRSQTSFVEK